LAFEIKKGRKYEMVVIPAKDGVRVLLVSFRRGDYIIESLRDYLQKERIDAALITSGIGSLDICRMHTIKHAGLPPEDVHYKLEGPIEVASMLGAVAGGEPHIHVTVDDVANDHRYVGHLEPGSRCCYRVEMGLIVLQGVKTRRVLDEKTNLTGIVSE
jgi:predicted DNA-binding protein with PD1-like motif